MITQYIGSFRNRMRLFLAFFSRVPIRARPEIILKKRGG